MFYLDEIQIQQGKLRLALSFCNWILDCIFTKIFILVYW